MPATILGDGQRTFEYVKAYFAAIKDHELGDPSREDLEPDEIVVIHESVQLLEKPRHTAKIYVGSGTDAVSGLSKRWQHYEDYATSSGAYVMLPAFVRAAIGKGYNITHKGTLVWVPLPEAANVPMFRLLFIALEVTFTFYFWAMYSQDKEYGMGSCTPWFRTSFTYRGFALTAP